MAIAIVVALNHMQPDRQLRSAERTISHRLRSRSYPLRHHAVVIDIFQTKQAGIRDLKDQIALGKVSVREAPTPHAIWRASESHSSVG